MNGKYLQKNKKLSEEVIIEQHFKSMFSVLEELNKELKVDDREQVTIILDDVKHMYITSLDIVLRTSVMKMK